MLHVAEFLLQFDARLVVHWLVPKQARTERTTLDPAVPVVAFVPVADESRSAKRRRCVEQHFFPAAVVFADERETMLLLVTRLPLSAPVEEPLRNAEKSSDARPWQVSKVASANVSCKAH